MDESLVELKIRTGGSTKPCAFRTENEWPIARTQWMKLYLDIGQDAPSKDSRKAEGSLSTAVPAAAKSRPGAAAGGSSPACLAPRRCLRVDRHFQRSTDLAHQVVLEARADPGRELQAVHGLGAGDAGHPVQG
jgi:hypothetical protein